MRRIALFIFPVTTILFIFSCGKDSQSDKSTLYGRWKTSYGDTITFAQENGTAILTYDMSLNNALPVDTKKEFVYQHDKLGIKDGLNGNDFRVLRSFNWSQRGHSFTVQGVEWFLFVNSTNTYFTFTKIW